MKAKTLSIEDALEIVKYETGGDDSPLEVALSRVNIACLARITQRVWKPMYFGAVPYVQAMREMYKVSDNYGCDDGRSIIAYFLSNASTWRGPVAKAVKAELNKRLKKG